MGENLIHLSVDGQVEAPSPSDEISINQRPAMWVVEGPALGQESIFGFWGNLGWLTCCLVPSRSAVAGGFLSLSILAHNASL